MNKALLYIRVSSKEQEDGYSLDAQEKMGIDYAARKGFTIVHTWKGAESAWDSAKGRAKFIQMVEYARKHTDVEHIIFDVTDRMTRNDADKMEISLLINHYGKTIHFARSNKIYNKTSSADELFIFDIEVALAKMGSKKVSEKTRIGLEQKAAQGEYPTLAPIGYLNNPLTRSVEIDKERAPYIQKAFSLMATGNYSIKMLNELLYREGLRSKKGNPYSKSALHRVLHHSFYYGVFRIKDRSYQGTHEPIISKALFDQVQAVLHGKDRVQPTIQRRGFAFANLASCGNCGCKVLGEIKKERYVYYHCSYSKGRREECVGYFTESGLADLFADSVRRITIPDEIVTMFKRHLKEFSSESTLLLEKKINTLQEEHSKVSSRLNRLFDMRLDNEIADEAFKQKKTELENNLVDLKSQMRQSERINPNFYEDGIKTLELCNSLYPQYLSSNPHDKSEILKTIASNYVINDVTITPTYRSPFNVFAKGASCPIWGGGIPEVRRRL